MVPLLNLNNLPGLDAISVILNKKYPTSSNKIFSIVKFLLKISLIFSKDKHLFSKFTMSDHLFFNISISHFLDKSASDLSGTEEELSGSIIFEKYGGSHLKELMLIIPLSERRLTLS